MVAVVLLGIFIYGNASGPIQGALLLIGFGVLLFLAVRDTIMWCWKINEIVKLLKERIVIEESVLTRLEAVDRRL